jgi:TusA-related sulfurtransferase
VTGVLASGARAGAAAAQAQPPARIDVRDVSCPLTWVRTRIALDRLPVGGELEVLLLAGEALENVPRTAEEEGHRVVVRAACPERGAGSWRVVLVKGAPPSPSELVP